MFSRTDGVIWGPRPVGRRIYRAGEEQQCQHSLYGLEQEFYDLSHVGPADRALHVMVQWITRPGEKARASMSQILDVGAAAEVTTARSRCQDKDYGRTYSIIDSLQEDLTTTRAGSREYL